MDGTRSPLKISVGGGASSVAVGQPFDTIKVRGLQHGLALAESLAGEQYLNRVVTLWHFAPDGSRTPAGSRMVTTKDLEQRAQAEQEARKEL